jgi:hypothetical protein
VSNKLKHIILWVGSKKEELEQVLNILKESLDLTEVEDS